MFIDLWSVVNTVAWSLIIITVIVDQAKTPAIPKFWKSDKNYNLKISLLKNSKCEPISLGTTVSPANKNDRLESDITEILLKVTKHYL